VYKFELKEVRKTMKFLKTTLMSLMILSLLWITPPTTTAKLKFCQWSCGYFGNMFCCAFYCFETTTGEWQLIDHGCIAA
jgi:hypothetical protein